MKRGLDTRGHICIFYTSSRIQSREAAHAADDTAGEPVSDQEIADIIENFAAAPLGMGEDEASSSRRPAASHA
jgi:hypothetical protein